MWSCNVTQYGLLPFDRVTGSLCCASSTVLLISCQCLKNWRPVFLTKPLKCLLRWALTNSMYWTCLLKCLLGMMQCSLLCRWTLAQRRTSLCMQHWKQSWLSFFTSCMTKLFRRMKPPDWHCPNQPAEKKTPKRGSTFICGHYCIRSHLLHPTLLRSASHVVFEAKCFFILFPLKLVIDSEYCYSVLMCHCAHSECFVGYLFFVWD